MKYRRKLLILWVYAVTLVHQCYSATNFKPYLKMDTVIKVPEDTPVGTSLLNVTAIDSENDTVQFGLDQVGETILQIRKIGPMLGELTLKKKLNAELIEEYTISVTVTDGGDDRKTSEACFLTVGDVNDNKPVFAKQPYWTSIPENTTVGSTVLIIQAKDADISNTAVGYKFSNDSNSAQTSKFSIQNSDGVITLISPLDYETTSRYLLPVVAEDNGIPKQVSQTTVVIDVTDISDNPPKFAQSVYLKEIYENTPVGTNVLTVVARDGDTGINNPMKYEMYAGNDGTFAIDATTGVITVNSTIDAEKTQSYKLYIRASEVPDPSSNTTVSVLITVRDKNDNPPLFSQNTYSFTLRENLAEPGRIVTDELIVRDADINPEFRQFRYHLNGGDSNKFSIDSSNGELRINSTLDYETQVNYTFTIVVTEIGTAEKYSDNATLYLELVNDNDNSPMFANTSYYYTFYEEIPTGREIAVVTATDADLGTFGQITYELKGDQSSFFAVDSTGNITAAKKLDYEVAHSYQFYLMASDGGGLSKNEKTTIVNVTLYDVNDNDPVFTGKPYISKIKENLASGVIILQVTVSDIDNGENGRLSLSIASGNTDSAFAINDTGFITTTKALDREGTASYTLTIIASDHGSPRRSVNTSVNVDILDENDNTPYIVLGSYIVKNINEGAGGGTILLDSLEAIDGDDGENSKLSYSMSGGDGRFTLNSETGRLQISPTGLDREVQSSYDLVINVTDNGSPKRQNSTTVHVNVLDINDNSPVFEPNPLESSAYAIELNEGPSTLNTVIIQLNATDKDEGLNGELIYSLTLDDHGYFSLDNITGKLTVIKELDREDKQMPLDASGNGRFLLDVSATDQTLPVSARKSATVRVVIKVKDINDNSPKFERRHYKTDVSEAARTGSNVIQVPAEDKDLEKAGKVTYNITNGDPNGMFEISSIGDISIKKILDAEEVSLYNLTVLAKDGGTPPLTSECFVVISVDDVNDNDPIFNQSTYTASVMENVAIGTTVLTVYAMDKDKGANGNVTYEISNGNRNTAFKINDVTGLITTAGPIDRENIQSYILTVKAEDQGQPSSRKGFTEVKITVDDENDNHPRFSENQYRAEIQENSLPGRTLAMSKEIHATDKDIGTFGQITYSLAGPGSENFNVNASTGIIATSNSSSLDRERNASYSLHVIATDGGNKNATALLTITIMDMNDEPPEFASSIYYANISEDAIQGSTVRKVTASDLDIGINSQFIYTSTGADGKFYVSRSTGNVIVDSSLDREFKSFYILNITASNIVKPFSEGHTQVYITITDVIDDKPYFSVLTISVSLPEDSQVGTNVTRVNGLDKDVGDTLSYAIVGGDTYGLFRIDNITGDIFTASSLDRENKTDHTLSVQAKDSKGLVSEKNFQVQVKVTDVNDNFPVFAKTEYTVDYREQSPKDTSILKVEAGDADSGTNAQIRYTIVENVTSQISINALTGLIFQGATELDREQQPFFNFTVNATDQGKPPRSTTAKVSITLVDINDNNPKFANETYRANVKENQPIGTFVFEASATDDDIGSNAKLIYGFSGSFRFKIDPDRGNISTGEILDREEVGASSYTLTLRAKDEAVRSREGSARLIVTVLDDNDHAPIFSEDSYAFEVSENEPINHLIGSVSSTDRDIDDNARPSYFITAGNEMNTFAINETTGKITTASSPDREKNDTFTLTILARDHGVPPLESNTTVTIKIKDQNDNKPVFSQRIYNVTLKESVPSGAEVITVAATDLDIGVNGKFTFQFASENDEQLFNIDKQSGKVTLRGRLDHETNPLINLTVAATDSGDPPMTGYTFVIIKVMDVDDNAPQFLKDNYVASIPENITQGSFVAQLNATDIDASEAHKTIHYRIEAGNTGDKFAIGGLNGTVYLKYGSSVYLNREEKEKYELTVAAISIVNQTEQKSTVPLKITVLDVNDETPSFEFSPYSVAVPEDRGDISGKDNTIVTITARDLDLGLNSEIVYSIDKGNEEDFFSLNNKTGELIKVRPLDRENISSFQLVVSATDKGVPPLSSNTNVSITVMDINDNKPSFEATQSLFHVKENITIGTTITIVKATDRDQGNNMYLEYNIISGNDDVVFSLNITSGELKTAKLLDHEKIAEYKLVIQAKNVKSDIELTSEKEITIFVTDVNDNRPLFSKTSRTVSVGENLPVGTVVDKIEAFDSDKSDPVYYYIYSSSGRDVFDLNETSGIMTTKKIIDREETPSFTMLIKASNYKLDASSLLNARKKRSVDPSNETSIPLLADKTLQRIKVEINDQNDNGPLFTKKTYTGGVSEGIQFGDQVIRVIAIDADIGNGGIITYGFSTTNEDSQRFTVDNDTGWIKAAASFADQRGKEFVLNISAKDNFGQGQYNSDKAVVKIYVLVDVERAVLVSSRNPDEVRSNKNEFRRVLQNITGFIINIDDVNFLKENGKYDYSKTAVSFHAVDPVTKRIVDRDEVIRRIDENYQKLESNRAFFNEWKIKEIKPYVSEKESVEFPFVLAVAIGLGLLLLIIIIIFVCIVCLLRKRQKRKLRAATAASYGGSNQTSRKSSLSLPNTNRYDTTGSNPMWVDPYQNWGATDDDDTSDFQTFKANGTLGHNLRYGDIIIRPSSTNPQFGSKEAYTNMVSDSDESPDYDLANGDTLQFSGSDNGHDRTPSPEPYESSPTSERIFYGNDSKYQVTSI